MHTVWCPYYRYVHFYEKFTAKALLLRIPTAFCLQEFLPLTFCNVSIHSQRCPGQCLTAKTTPVEPNRTGCSLTDLFLGDNTYEKFTQPLSLEGTLIQACCSPYVVRSLFQSASLAQRHFKAARKQSKMPQRFFLPTSGSKPNSVTVCCVCPRRA